MVRTNCFQCGKFKECSPQKIEVNGNGGRKSKSMLFSNMFGSTGSFPAVKNICKSCRKWEIVIYAQI